MLDANMINEANIRLFIDLYLRNFSKDRKSMYSTNDLEEADILGVNSEALFLYQPDSLGGEAVTHSAGYISSVADYNKYARKNNFSFIMESSPVDRVTMCSLEDQVRLVRIINSCYFEEDELCEADAYFNELIGKYGGIQPPLGALAEIVAKHLSDEHILEGVLHILSNYSYDVLRPFGISVALSCRANYSPVISDLLISCIASWEAVEGIEALEQMEFKEAWLEQYRDHVVAQLKEKVHRA